MQLFRYARISARQSPTLTIKIKVLKKAGVKSNRIFTDKVSGSHTERERLRLLC
jgi:hypothetical protein